MVRINQEAGRSILIGFLFPILFGLLFTDTAAASVILRDLKPANMQLLLDDLSEKSGLRIEVGNDYRLFARKSYESERLYSRTLRRFLEKVLEDESNVFIVYDRSGSSRTNFGFTDAGTNELHSGRTRYEVGIDFSDLKRSKRFSSSRSLAAFTPALILFHEIDHKISYDKHEPIPKGGVRKDHSHSGHVGVIERTNRVRLELGLPLRVVTTPKLRKYRGPIEAFKNTIEIPFRNSDGAKTFLRFRPTR